MALSVVCLLFLFTSAAVGQTPSTPTRIASDYRLRYREPGGCEPDNCNYFVGIDTNEGNSSFLDIYLVGKARGWVAVGFSETPDMPQADVVGCSVETADSAQVLVIDTYNPGYYNEVDQSETDTSGNPSDVVTYLKESVTGRIKCVFSRKIEGLDPSPQDLTLNKKLYLEFARSNTGRDSPSVAEFAKHNVGAPIISSNQYNPAADEGEIVNAKPDIITVPQGLPTKPTRNASEYRLRYRHPHGCAPDDCNYFVGIDTNEGDPSFLDFYLVGKAKGWVAVGFSKTANMFKTDVLGCSVDSDGTFVLAVDTYNPPDNKVNKLDDSEEATNGEAVDIVAYIRDYTEGTIRCMFSREIEGIDPCPQDFLLNHSYYLQFGHSDKARELANVSNFHYHDIGTPTISKRAYNPATSGGEIGVSTMRNNLILVHGVLMLVAWPLLSFVAIFFAAWMKPALPNGQWFQVHRAFNLAALLVAVVGFIVVFVAHKDESTPGLIDFGSGNKLGTAHFALGIVIMAFHILNPLISLCRCKPTGEKRWIYNVVHGLVIGYGLQILAYVSMGLGVARFDEELTESKDMALVWLYVAIATLSLLFNLSLFLLFTGEAALFKRNVRSISPTLVAMLWKFCNKYSELEPTEQKMELEDSSHDHTNTNLLSPPPSSSSSTPSPPKKPSTDAPLRWVALIIILAILLPALVSLIFLMITRSENLN